MPATNTHIHVVYPGTTAALEPNRNIQYFIKLLELALLRSDYAYTLSPVSTEPVSENRSHLYLKTKRYNVHWMMTTKAREEELIPVKIPLYKGLIGWRIFYIRRDDEQVFAGIKNADELRELRAGLGHDWPDVPILTHSGFKVSPMFSGDGRFDFINHNRCDYFSRSVVEVWGEYEESIKNDLVLEKSIALHYPAAYYFFVSPDEIDIANAIKKGLYRAIESGEFEKLFKERFYNDIAKSNIRSRRVFSIDNPSFEDGGVLAEKKLWFQPEEYH